MEAKILESALTQSLWAALFVVLLFYVLRENGRRECKYQEIIDNLTQRFAVIEEVKDDVCKIKEKIFYK